MIRFPLALQSLLLLRVHLILGFLRTLALVLALVLALGLSLILSLVLTMALPST